MKNIQNTSPTTTKEDDRILELEEKVEKLEALIHRYQEHFRLKAHQKFGRSSEKQVNMAFFFMRQKQKQNLQRYKKTNQGKMIQKKTKRKKRASLDPNLPTETMTHSLPLSEQACSDCGNGLHAMKTEIRHEIQIIPAQVRSRTKHLHLYRQCDSRRHF